MQQKISVFGTGYVGLVTGLCFAEYGNTVIGADIDSLKIENLKKGISPIYEIGIEELLHKNIASRNISFTWDIEFAIKNSDILMIAVGTPPNEDGSADLKYVLKVAETIAEYMTTPKIIVTKSTVPVGTYQKVKKVIQDTLKKRNLNLDFDVVSNPEFLREGCAISDCLNPDRAIVGVETERPVEKMKLLYTPMLKGKPLHVMTPASSEMTKYAANSILATKISVMNEFSRLCEIIGADIESVKEGLSSDHRIGPHFINAGVGYGGSCFPKDVKALIHTGEQFGENMQILKSVEEANFLQRKNFFNKINSHFDNNLKDKKIAIWGVAFKPGTDDIREAPAIYLIEKLIEEGCLLNVYDPIAASNTLTYFDDDIRIEFENDSYEALTQVDALCILTEWNDFKNPDFNKMLSAMKSPVIFDGRNIYNPKILAEKGFTYHSIGRSNNAEVNVQKNENFIEKNVIQTSTTLNF